MLGKKITVTVAQPEVQLAGEGRKVLYKGSVALGDHSSPKPVYLISYGDPKPEQPATVIAVVSSKGKEQFVACLLYTSSFILIRNNFTVKAFPGKERERKRCLRFPQKGAFWRLVGDRIFDSSGTGGKTLRLPQARKRLFVCWTGR